MTELTKPAQKPRKIVKTRKCLQCGLTFSPKHTQNWICRKCKTKRVAIEWAAWGGDILIDCE